ncbi:hypothetical protein [Ideonella sp. BN130291]|uniref:hypothetical protein n=1 Tax=Ideonella sp. BN130291 TaxID=3112940 RepID=UPI002E26D313|nr:hypothetical protein [Ideonella sp. BN130291]
MLTRPHSNPTLLSLARLLAGWLALIVLVQGGAAVHARLLQGALHRHAAVPAQPASIAWRLQAKTTEPAHRHDEWQRHHHAQAHATAVPGEPEPDAGIDATAGLLALAFLSSGWVTAVPPSAGARHVWRPAPGWFMASRSLRPLRRPPRR